MGSRDDKSTLPPLIDFGDNDTPLSTDPHPFDYAFSSPSCDPFSVFELPFVSPAGSSSSPILEQWDAPHSAAAAESSFMDQWDETPLAISKVNIGTRHERDFSISNKSSPESKSNSYRHSLQDKDFLSSNSSGSVLYPQIDLLSSPDVSSHRQRAESEPSPCMSSLSNQTPPSVNRLPLQACDSMSLHIPVIGEEPYLRDSDLRNEFSASFDSPPSASQSSSDPNPHILRGGNDDFWSKEGNKWEQSQTNCDRLKGADEEHSWPPEDLSWSLQHGGSLTNAGQDNIHLQQNTARLQESYGANVGRGKEFRSGRGGKGFYKAPDRDVDGPVAFELRPQPFKELPVQPTGVLACTDTCLWLASDQGFIVWDIPSAFRSSCDGRDNMKGDQDAAAYTKLMHGLATTCLYTDTTNHIMWSGHKDGKVRAWPIVLEHESENAVNRNVAIFTWQAHQTPVLAIVVSSYGELWTGSEGGSLRVWPQSAIAQAFSSSKDLRLVAASFLATSYIDLKARGLASGASSFATIDMRFLIAEHSQCRVWSGGSHLLALWDARTKELLKVFGSNADAEFLSPNVSPVRDMGRGEEVKVNATKASKKEKSQGALSFFQRSRNAVLGAADAVLRAAVGQSIDDSKRCAELQ